MMSEFFLSRNRYLDLTDFQRMTLAFVILMEGIATIAWQMFTNHQMLLLLTFVLHGLAFWLAYKNVYLSGALWVCAYVAFVVGYIGIYEAPLVAILFGLLPLFVVLIFGLLPGLLVCGLVTWAMMFLAGQYPDLTLLPDVSWPVIAGSTVSLLFGAVFRFWFLDTIWIYYENYLRAVRDIELARTQRVEYKQVEEDLLHANRELARLTRQLKVANHAAEEARRAKETFVATVSHELRTPLNMIIGFSEVIAQSPQVYGKRLSSTLLADIASIQRNSQHLLELVNDVLDLSQVDMGNLSIMRMPCSLQNLVSEAFDVIRPLFVSKGLYLTSQLPQEDVIIDCDQTRIREVIINLLSNAGRFTEVGGVFLSARQEDTNLVIAVQDTGPGIAPEDQARLFEPFQQLDSSIRRKHGGSGLGLAISKRFVEMHGGQMGLESIPGQGTTFFFRLPLSMHEMKSASSAARWVNPYSVVDARQRPFRAPAGKLVPRLLVLEEGDMARHLFERYLSDVEVVGVPDVQALASHLEESPAQLLAVNYPEGAGLLHSVMSSGQLPFGLPILAFWLPGAADMASSLNVTRYLIKPVSKETLTAALAEVASTARTILLVDDNPEVLQLFGRILSATETKYQVLRAMNGQQALDMLRKRHPDVMILDLIMPEMSGFQALEEKARDPDIRDIPVIVISAQDPAGVMHVSDRVTLARTGGFTPRDLLELIRSLVAPAEEQSAA